MYVALPTLPRVYFCAEKAIVDITTGMAKQASWRLQWRLSACQSMIYTYRAPDLRTASSVHDHFGQGTARCLFCLRRRHLATNENRKPATARLLALADLVVLWKGRAFVLGVPSWLPDI